jgi:hypothetical protein
VGDSVSISGSGSWQKKKKTMAVAMEWQWQKRVAVAGWQSKKIILKRTARAKCGLGSTPIIIIYDLICKIYRVSGLVEIIYKNYI